MDGKKTTLEQGLEQLRVQILLMCASVGKALDEACDALSGNKIELARRVVEGDAAVNALENEIDEAALGLLVRNQPVARDLRFIVAALRMVIDLERIGDEAASIAEHVPGLKETPPEAVGSAVAELMRDARTMYERAVITFREEDPERALELISCEDACSQREIAALRGIMENFAAGGSAARQGRSEQSMRLVLVCRALNRICRRAVNIAEHTYFIAQGINIKHAQNAEAHKPAE